MTVRTAIAELVDNSLDSAALQGIDPVEVTVEIDPEAGELVYRDRSGGVREDEMGVFLGLGQSREKRADKQNVGTFGMGAKKALKRLGDEIEIASRHLDGDTGWTYTVESEWFQDRGTDPGDWSFDMEPVDLEPGQTVLKIRELNFDPEFRGEDKQTYLNEWFASTYRKFLRPNSDVGLDLDLEIGGEVIEPPLAPDWSFSPFLDGLHPRKFTGLEFTNDDWSEPINATVTVGLLREGDADRCGTFIYCQNRLIEANLTDRDGGYGLSNGLNTFSTEREKRFRVEIDLFGDASDLPWNSDKSRIRTSHESFSTHTRGIFWWLRRLADRHKSAGKYGKIRYNKSLFQPYGPDHSHAANGGEIEEIDVSGKHRRLRQGKIDQIRVFDKPDNDYDPLHELARHADTHTRLGIVAASPTQLGDGSFDTAAESAYHGMIGEVFSRELYDVGDREFAPPADDTAAPVGRYLLDVDDPDTYASGVADDGDWAQITEALTRVDTVPDWTADESRAETVLRQLVDVATDDYADGRRQTALDDWQQPRYEAELRAHAATGDREFEDLEAVDEPLALDVLQPDEPEPTTGDGTDGDMTNDESGAAASETRAGDDDTPAGEGRQTDAGSRSTEAGGATATAETDGTAEFDEYTESEETRGTGEQVTGEGDPADTSGGEFEFDETHDTETDSDSATSRPSGGDGPITTRLFADLSDEQRELIQQYLGEEALDDDDALREQLVDVLTAIDRGNLWPAIEGQLDAAPGAGE